MAQAQDVINALANHDLTLLNPQSAPYYSQDEFEACLSLWLERGKPDYLHAYKVEIEVRSNGVVVLSKDTSSWGGGRFGRR